MHTQRLATCVAGFCAAMVATASAQQPAASPPRGQAAYTPQMVALGDSIFHGLAAGGLCFGCHGPDGKGVPGVAPDLTAGKWLHGDGSYSFLTEVITSGVPKPQVARAPMPPMGGSKLSEAEIRAVEIGRAHV